MCARISIHDEHAPVVIVSVVLIVALVIAQASTTSAQVFQPQPIQTTPKLFEPLIVPDKGTWPNFAPKPLFSSHQEIESLKTHTALKPDVTNGILHRHLARNANLKGLYLYTFEQRDRYGRFVVDYVVPFQASDTRVRFAELHGEFEDLAYYDRRPARRDLSLGLGQRTIRKDYLLGINTFLDGSSVSDKWYWSGGLGFEAAFNVASNALDKPQHPFEVLDVSLNLYKGGGLELETGCSLRLNDYMDLRLNVGKYRFYDGEYLLGWKGGADFRASGGLFELKYEYGQDRVNSSYHTVGASLCVPLQLENLFQGRCPFSLPDSLLQRKSAFQNLAEDNVTRSWRHPQSVVTARPALDGGHAPGSVRWDWGKDFSPTECFWAASALPEKEKTDLFTTIGYTLGRVAVTAVVGVFEYSYRWLFGPYKTRPPENPENPENIGLIAQKASPSKK